MAIVQVEKMRFAMLDDQSLRADFIILLVFRTDGEFAVDLEQRKACGADGRGPIIGDVEIEVAIPINVGQSHRSAGILPD